MSEYSLFERQEAVQSDLGYDYTVVQIEVSVEMDWASFSVVSHITYSVQSEMRALMGNSGSGSALHLDRWVFLSCQGALGVSAAATMNSRESPLQYCQWCCVLLRESSTMHARSSDCGWSVLLQSNQQTLLSKNWAGAGDEGWVMHDIKMVGAGGCKCKIIK